MFDLYLRGAQCILHCNHKPLDPFLSCGMKMPKLNPWSVLLPDYSLMLFHRGSNSILADAISGLKTLDIYKDSLDYPISSDTMTCIVQMVTAYIQTLSINKPHAKQKKDIHCKNLTAQSHVKNKNTFHPVMISPDGLLKHNMNMD